MKKWLSILVLLVLPVLGMPANETLGKAEKAYDAKDYKAAVSLYEELIKEGYSSYQLYYNLGNSYYKNGELGRAIHAYEIARKIEPDEEDVKINLGIANSKTIDKIDTKENFFITAVKSNILHYFTTSTWAWFTIFSLLISCSAFFVFYVFSSGLVKRIALSCSLAALFLFILTYFLGNSALQAKLENKFAIVLVKEIKIMNEPTMTATTKFRLHEGTKVRVVENNGNWLLIKLENGNEGWLKTEEIGVI